MKNREFGLGALRRYLTLKTDRIHSLPIVILMPHSRCNCRCVMCDIWKGNGDLRRLAEEDVRGMLDDFERLGTEWVVMSGGEALMNRDLFQFCDLLRERGLKVTILSTGLLLEKFAREVVEKTDEVIVSLDGPEPVHDAIRRIPNAYAKLREGVRGVKAVDPRFAVSGRCVIQRLNYAVWPDIVEAAREIGLDAISFLAADVSSEAFNRPGGWDEERKGEVRLDPSDLQRLERVVEDLIRDFRSDFESGFIVESPDRLRRIARYYAALGGEGDLPPVRCNAPWVSAVVEADGTVRPCFFHEPLGNVRNASLKAVLDSPEALAFRRGLDPAADPICRTCVCSLNLRPTEKVVQRPGETS